MGEFLAPTLLVATPPLVDPNFKETVVLLFLHNKSGAMGIVINRPTEYTVGEILGHMTEVDYPYLADTVFWGGPVSRETGWFVFKGEDPSNRSLELGKGLRISGSLDLALALPSVAEGSPIFYMGYAGWAPGQLEREIEEGAWLTTDLDPELIFEVPVEKRWNAVYERLGIDPTMWVSTPGEG